MPERIRPDINPLDAHALNLRRQALALILSGAEIIPVSVALDAAIAAAVKAATDSERFFSYTQLTERWGLSRKAVERLHLDPFKFGGSIRFRKRDIVAYEERSRTR